MIYAELKNNIVQSIRSGNPQRVGITAYIELPNNHQVRPFTTMDFYTQDFQQKPVSQLLAEGLIEPPENMIWDKEEQTFRAATDKELIEDDRKTLSERETLDGEYVVEKTPQQLYEEKLLSPEEETEYLSNLYKIRLQEIDVESARPLRAVLSNTATEYDNQKLLELEDEAAELRKQLSRL